MTHRKPRIKSETLRLAPADMPCMFAIPDVCRNDGSVLCHIRVPGEGGAGMKPDDLIAAAGCRWCHDVFDGRAKGLQRGSEDWLYYALRALSRNLRALQDAGKLGIRQ
jgi:hypothetical protein